MLFSAAFILNSRSLSMEEGGWMTMPRGNVAVLIENAGIWDTNRSRPFTGSLLIAGDRIVSAGEAEQVTDHPASRNAFRIDAAGSSVIPGMTDSHLHLTALSRQRSALSLFEASSKEELLEMIRRRASELGPGDWVYGVRFDNSRWADTTLPTLEELDSLGIPNPVLLLRVCAHLHVVNSRALQEAGLAAEDISGAGAVRDKKGCFTGTLRESFAQPVVQAMKRSSTGGIREAVALREAMLELASQGITCIHTCSASSYGLEENLEAFHYLHDKGELPIRIRLYSDVAIPGWTKSGEGDDWLCYGGKKFFLDGSLGGRTAAMTFPYEDDPSTRGMLNMDTGEFIEQVREEHLAGNQVQVHAIGDAAIDQFIKAMEALKDLAPLKEGLRHRVVHIQICRPDQIERLARLGVVCDIQPVFVPSDIHITKARVGKDRLGWAYAWKSMLQKGVLLTGSSDAPVEPTNPWRGIWAAVNRVDDEGKPEGGWLPDQRLTVDEALALFTLNPAKAVGAEDRFGSLRPGKAADLVILDRNIYRTPPEELRQVRPVMTIVGGEVRFVREA